MMMLKPKAEAYAVKRFRASMTRLLLKEPVKGKAFLDRVNSLRASKGLPSLTEAGLIAFKKEGLLESKKQLIKGMQRQEKKRFLGQTGKEYDKLLFKAYYDFPSARKKKLARMKDYGARPEVKAARRKYRQEYEALHRKPKLPEAEKLARRKAYDKARALKPAAVEKRRAYARQYYKWYRKLPEIKEKIKVYRRAYAKRPEVVEKRKAFMRKRYQRPEVKAKQREQMMAYNLRKKQEKENQFK
ncbi:hypothetical protein HZB89_00085 [archaeon]|nr:hypothetical protein [archaeon]